MLPHQHKFDTSTNKCGTSLILCYINSYRLPPTHRKPSCAIRHAWTRRLLGCSLLRKDWIIRRGCSTVIYTIVLVRLSSASSLAPSTVTPFPWPTLFVIPMIFSLPNKRQLHDWKNYLREVGPTETRARIKSGNQSMQALTPCSCICVSGKEPSSNCFSFACCSGTEVSSSSQFTSASSPFLPRPWPGFDWK